MKQKDFSKKILISVTGNKNIHWQSKLKEIKKYKISKIALFLECFEKNQRQNIYEALLNSNIKEIPLVHIRNDMTKQELKFLVKHFNSKYLTIHEDSFDILKKWRGYYKYLYLEMNADNYISRKVNIKKIGGFCVDLSHYKKSEVKNSREYDYTFSRKNNKRYFPCNHLNGYSYKENMDLHTVKKLSDFNYLKTLPKFLFGKIIALEVNNSIFEQLKFKEHLIKFL